MALSTLDYILAQSIGRGSFGSVYYAINKQTGEEVAIKVLNKKALAKQVYFNDSSDGKAETGVTQVYEEISFMQQFINPFLLRFIDSIDQDDKIYIITELAEGIVCSIHQHDVQPSNLPECISNLLQLYNPLYSTSALPQLALHVAAGIAFLHQKNQLHGDIKPANILRTADGRYILGDFGLARSVEKGRNYHEIVSPAFAAPDTQGLTQENDVWAFGVCLFMLMYGQHPAVISADIWRDEKISHWGQVLIQNRDAALAALEKRKKQTVEGIVQSKYKTQKFYNIKLNIEIVKTIYNILTEIIQYCFLGRQERVSMLNVFLRMADFYGKIAAAQNYKSFNQQFSYNLHNIIQRLNVANSQHMHFLICLSGIRGNEKIKEAFQQIFDKKVVKIENIDFSQFDQFVQYHINQKLIDTISMSQSNTKISDMTRSTESLGVNNTPLSIEKPVFKKVLPAISLASGLANLPPPNTEPNVENAADEDEDQITPICMPFVNQQPQMGKNSNQGFKKVLPSISLASKLANLPAPGAISQMTTKNAQPKKLDYITPQLNKSDSDLSEMIIQSSSSDKDNSPSRQSSGKQHLEIASDSDGAINVLPLQDCHVRASGGRKSSLEECLQQMDKKFDSQEKFIPISKSVQNQSNSSQELNGNINIGKQNDDCRNGLTAPPVQSDSSEVVAINVGSQDSSSGGSPNEGLIQPLLLQSQQKKSLSSDSLRISEECQQNSIYGKFKKPESLASKMAAQLASLPPPNEVGDSGEEDGYVFIMGAKPKKQETQTFKIDLREQPKESSATPRSNNQLQMKKSFTLMLTKYLEDDDVFCFTQTMNRSPDSGCDEPQVENVSDPQKSHIFKTDLHQRFNFFLSTGEMLSQAAGAAEEIPTSRQVKSLFRQISYTNDEFKHKKQPFTYDHNADQAKLIGLGSFACETLSTGERSQEEDFSDNSDDLVEFDAQDDETFTNSFNQVFNLEDDSNDKEMNAVTASSLVNRGKGRFKTVNEEEEEEIKPLRLNSVFIVEEDGQLIGNEQTSEVKPPPGLPFRLTEDHGDSTSDSNKFQMKVIESSSDEALPPVHPTKFSLQLTKLQQDKEQKIKLFEQEESTSYDNTQLKSARILISGRGDKVQYSKSDVLEGVIQTDSDVPSQKASARAEYADSYELSPKQTVIYFHNLIMFYRRINRNLAEQDSQILADDDYRFVKGQLDEIIDSIINKKAIVLVITLDIFITRYEQWIQQLEQYFALKQGLDQQLAQELNQIKAMFSVSVDFIDRTPALLNAQTSWISLSQISFILNYQSQFDQLFRTLDKEYSLTINEQAYHKSCSSNSYIIQMYIGVDYAECTPIVGLRHKVGQKGLAIQLSQAKCKMLENEEALKLMAEKAQTVTSKSQSLEIFQSYYYSFAFLQLGGDIEQKILQNSKMFKYYFVSTSLTVVLPFPLLESILDLIVNSVENSEPGTIRVSMFNAENAFYAVVSDCGHGILQENAESVFVLNGDKIGAGLARLRLVVGLYGGVINVSSENQCGCRIIVKIPMCEE